MKNTIETERLILRRFTIKDSGRLTYLFNDEDMVKYLISLPYPYTESHGRQWISHHNENFVQDKIYDFALVNKADDRVIGSISLTNNKDHKNGSVAYMIGKEYWNLGYATEALKAIISYAFNVKGYHKVYAEFIEGNDASGRVMEKSGMVFEGKKLDHIYKDGSFHTLFTYCIINDDIFLDNFHN